MKTKKRLKLVVLLFAMTLLAGTAFASANGALFFNGTVRINNVHTVQQAQLTFISASIRCLGQATVSLPSPNVLSFETTLNSRPDHNWPGIMSQIDFQFENTGHAIAELIGIQSDGNLAIDVSFYRADGQSLDNSRLRQVPPDPSRLFVYPGEVITGRIMYTPLSLVLPGDVYEVVVTTSFTLDYVPFVWFPGDEG